ncbi:hypothetical protein YC2023_051310 [Brassica napus]
MVKTAEFGPKNCVVYSPPFMVSGPFRNGSIGDVVPHALLKVKTAEFGPEKLRRLFIGLYGLWAFPKWCYGRRCYSPFQSYEVSKFRLILGRKKKKRGATQGLPGRSPNLVLLSPKHASLRNFDGIRCISAGMIAPVSTSLAFPYIHCFSQSKCKAVEPTSFSIFFSERVHRAKECVEVNGVKKESKTPRKSDCDPFLRPITFCSSFEGQNS